MQRISIDFDNVLYNLEGLNCKVTKDIYGVEITPKDIAYQDYYLDHYPEESKIWSSFEEYSKGSFFQGDKDFIEELKNKYELQIVTASAIEISEEKDKMIYERYGDIKIIHTKEKYIHTKDSILIDDAIHNIKDHIEKNKDPGILVDRGYGWNQNFEIVPRVSSFKEIIKEIDKLRRF